LNFHFAGLPFFHRQVCVRYVKQLAEFLMLRGLSRTYLPWVLSLPMSSSHDVVNGCGVTALLSRSRLYHLFFLTVKHSRCQLIASAFLNYCSSLAWWRYVVELHLVRTVAHVCLQQGESFSGAMSVQDMVWSAVMTMDSAYTKDLFGS